MANWSNPTLTSLYTNFVDEVKNRDVDLALQFDGVTATNLPTNAIRWNSTLNRWQKWSGTAWGELTAVYALTNVSATGFMSATSFSPFGTAVPQNGLYLQGTNALGFATNSVARFAIDSTGRCLINATGTNLGGTNSLLQIRPSSGATAADDAILVSHDNRAGVTVRGYLGSAFDKTVFSFQNARGTLAAPTAVANDDWIGKLDFCGYDGATFVAAATIRGNTEGTPVASSGRVGGQLQFFTQPSTGAGAGTALERMRIMGDGSIRVSQTATSTPGFNNSTAGLAYEVLRGLCVSRDISAVGEGPALSLNNNFTGFTGTTRTVTFRRNGTTEVGYIETTSSTTTFSTSSDYRLKENVADLTDAIDRLKNLKPKRFNFISDPGRTLDGFLAHEAQDVVPQAVGGIKDGEDADGNPVYQGIDNSHLVPLLTAALQEAIARIETLEAAQA